MMSEPLTLHICKAISNSMEIAMGKVEKSGQAISFLGNPALLDIPLLAVFGSMRCPAANLLRAHDLAHAWRQAETGIISGFHSPVEKEILTVLLGGTCPILVALGRGLEGLRIPLAWRIPMEKGRMLLVSPFDGKVKRSTRETAEKRNHFAGGLADDILIIYVSEAGRLEEQVREWENAGKQIQRLVN